MSKKKPCGKLVFLDNNGTTLISPEAEKVYSKWLKCYNPSSDSKISKESREIVDKSRGYIQKLYNAGNYEVIFTSGATESNCFILRSSVESYKKRMGVKPHVVVSAVEHHSVLECCDMLEKYEYAEVTKVQPNIYGNILPGDVKRSIKSNTCLISIMYANNELGALNNIPEIGKIAHENGIPLHSDCVRMIGKYNLDLEKNNVDAISASFHKFHGPKGIGLLLIKRNFLNGYELDGQINGSQQHGLRGGTENVPAIASGVEALKHSMKTRDTKNKRIRGLRDKLIVKLSKAIKPENYQDYVNKDPPQGTHLVILGPPVDKPRYYIGNTLLFAVANTEKEVCNVAIKKELDKKGVVVSISSACLTSSPKASHVLDAIMAPPIIKRGVFRISFSDQSRETDVNTFMREFVKILKDQGHLRTRKASVKSQKKDASKKKSSSKKERKESKEKKESKTKKNSKK